MTRANSPQSVARCKNAGIALDTDLAGNPDAFKPAQLLLAALTARMAKGIERGTRAATETAPRQREE